MTGSVQGLLASLGGQGIVSPLPAIGVYDDELFPTDATGSISVNSDGSLSVTGNTSYITGADNWYLPTTAGIGSGYWVRLTVDSGWNPTGDSTGVWLPLSSSRTWTWTVTNNSTKLAVVTIEIASEADGTPVVTTGAGINVAVSSAS